MAAREATVEEAERRVSASLALEERQAAVTPSREESLRAHEAMTAKFLSSLQAREGDVARREE